MLKLGCHCGNLVLAASMLPTDLTRCNCSICYRLGAYWAYYDSDDVTITIGNHAVENYAWGEKTILYYRCGRCGCTTHYTSILLDNKALTAINCRMASPSDVADIPIKLFDGRSSWQYLEDKNGD